MYEEYFSAADACKDEIFAVSDEIFDLAETAYQEFGSSRILADALEKKGFTVVRGAGGIPTCFTATYGSGHPLIGLQAEYDALNSLSQEPCTAEKKPVPGRTTGHGCGHNLFAAGSFAAALAVKDYIDKTGHGSLRFFGCPAEEGGAGKVFMVRAGLYDGTDAVVSWHPVDFTMVRTRPSLANVAVKYSFSGTASHAGASPDEGRSALDAAELMNVGTNFLREHMDTRFRIHYAFLDTGGLSPNVVQDHAELLYLIRANDSAAVRELHRRVDLLADGAAMMTETSVRKQLQKAYSDLITIPALQKTADEALRDIPYPQPAEEDIAFALRLRETFPHPETYHGQPPYETAVQEMAPPAAHGGSTDTADVSWVCPTVQLHVGCWVTGTPGHSWQAVAQGKCRFAKEMMLFAGKAEAGTVIRLLESPGILEQAKKEHAERTKGAYVCPIPPEIQPPI